MVIRYVWVHKLPSGFQTAIYPTHFDQKHTRFELLCRILHRSYTHKLHQMSDNEVTVEWTSKPDVPTSSRMLLVLVLLLWSKPRLFLPLETGCLRELWWTELLQLGVGAFIYILPSRTNPPIAHGQNNSGARHRTRFLYVPDISTCKLRLPSRWLVRCDVILISDRHKTGVTHKSSL